jgi:GNAT superfamily N-acetyltransferase
MRSRERDAAHALSGAKKTPKVSSSERGPSSGRSARSRSSPTSTRFLADRDAHVAVRKAKPSDRADVLKTLTAAFRYDAIIRYQFTDDATYDARAEAFFGHYFDVRLEGGEIFVAEDGAGAALWNPPGGNRLGSEYVEAHWRAQVVPALSPDEIARYDAFREVLDAMTPAEPHWYLGLLGTRPERQRTGVARALLEPMLDRADDESMPVFLETGVPGNVEIYRRFGFAPIADEAVPDGPRVWGMVRKPSGQKAR